MPRVHTSFRHAHPDRCIVVRSCALQTNAKEAALAEATAQHVRAANLESALQDKNAEGSDQWICFV